MSQEYSDESRIDEPYALPDIEIWHQDKAVLADEELAIPPYEIGWYYWFCFPGCLPDNEAMGPFETHEEALAGARGDEDGS